MSNFKMDDYVPVNERIAALKAEFPDCSLQSEIVELTAGRVTVRAYAYRTPDDPRPGIGHSSLEIPGSTPFTRGSEIENAETSAWGRAIAALGFEVKRGLASAEEVRNKQPEQRRGAQASSPNAAAPVPPNLYRRDELAVLLAKNGLDVEYAGRVADRLGIPDSERPMSNESMDRLIEAIESEQAASAHAAAPTDTPDVDARSTRPATTSDPEDKDSSPGPASGSASAPTDEQILAAAGEGAEMVPPAPGTPEYRVLPAIERAKAKAYHEAHKAAPQQETLAEALGAPAGG